MIIDLSKPIRSERVRAGFQPHWRTVFVYKCGEAGGCGKEHRIYANSFRGKMAVPGVGGIKCGCNLKHEEV